MRRYRKPYRVKKKKSIFKGRFFWLGVLILIIFFGTFYLIFFSPPFQIKNIEISGNSASVAPRADKQRVLFSEIQKTIEAKINQKILFFPSKSIFLIDFKETKKEILKKFPQIEEIDLKRKFPDRILIQIKERKPVAIFCLAPPPNLAVGQDGNCLFIDREGIVFDSAQTKQEFVVLKKEIGQEINLGEKVIKEEELSKILEVKAKLKNELKILPEEILVVSEERFNVKTSDGWQIYFNFNEDLNWQLTKLRAVLEKEIPPERRKNLEYIDLRFGNFAPYKYSK